MQDYKCLCAGVTICATIVAQKFDFYIFTPVTQENRSNWGCICQLVHSHQMNLRCKFGDHRSVTCRDNAHVSFFCDDLKTPVKQARSMWSLVSDQGSLVGPCMQDYKCLRTAVTICASLVNIQTHTHTKHFDQLK